MSRVINHYEDRNLTSHVGLSRVDNSILAIGLMSVAAESSCPFSVHARAVTRAVWPMNEVVQRWRPNGIRYVTQRNPSI
jgi:hypothetical protein